MLNKGILCSVRREIVFVVVESFVVIVLLVVALCHSSKP